MSNSNTERVREIQCTATVRIEASTDAPADWIERVTYNDFPYRNWNGQPLTEQQGLFMLADNALRNGVDDASRLDGWGDLDRGMVTMEVADVEVDA